MLNLGTIKRVAVVGAAGVPLLLGAIPAMTVSAGGGGGGGGFSSPGVTVTVAPTATLTSRILVDGTVITTCGPLYNYDGTVVVSTGFISVEQAAGRSIVGAGGTYAFSCTGNPETGSYGATGGPFHPGTAVADANFGQQNGSLCGYTDQNVSQDGNYNSFECIVGDSGSTVITLRSS
jgi:hypothetical protein